MSLRECPCAEFVGIAGCITGCGAIAVWARFATANVSILPQTVDKRR